MNPKTKTALIVCSILSVLLMMFAPLLIGGAVVGSIAGGLSSIENSGTTTPDRTDTCEPADTVATASMGKLEGDTTAAKLADAFAKAGFSKEATAGMMGNVQWESGFRADAINEIGATGIMQWYPGSKVTDWFNTQDDLKGRPATDEEGQIRMAVWVGKDKGSWNNVFLSKAIGEGMRAIDNDLYQSWLRASSPEDAALAWHWGFERAGDATGPRRQSAARDFYDRGLAGLTFTGKPDTSGASAQTGMVRCDTGNASSAGNVQAGKVGGAPEGVHDYSWMCSTTGVCHDGDGFSGDRIKYPHNVGRYQCVWYAWNRLGMIHGLDGWDWVLGNGGDIARNLSGKPGWTVDATPHAGDGISQVGGALGGAPPYGHVAVVEEVQTGGDGWRIRISEGNYGTGGNGAWTGYNSRWLTQQQFAGAGNVFFRFNGWKE